MLSSHDDRDAAAALGATLSGGEAGAIAERLADGQPLHAALRVLSVQRRALVGPLAERIGTDRLVPLLHAVSSARAQAGRLEAVWTMPGPLAQTGPLTASIVHHVQGARQSVTCSTFNFQRSSGLWAALRAAAQRPGVNVRVYLDAAAAQGGRGTPTAEEVAAHLDPEIVLRTKDFDGAKVRNHAKFVIVDHRFVLVTSANLSWSAEFANIELGIRADDASLAESIERELLNVEDRLYERVAARLSRFALRSWCLRWAAGAAPDTSARTPPWST
ncbi:DISARM system phospholipase D-like protein DrmC [Glycomyces tritici]|uniref:DISARM system phospholipase D-like protein DrmC n=1 Tax=Glycomyces tritici TaxID=2665176 RepID=A0ABT7YXQ1_9ACTN|nr:DISARM system phospholipase D-like protein DrmC [Glycomyces tritici]MDN3243429.1 DISARM system phospholipase D-like protein DrmC [Glycomyces tritici]